MLSQRQIRGIIAVSIFLAVIPFFCFIKTSLPDFHGPMLSISGEHSLAVEFIGESGSYGIYFIEPQITLKQLLKCIDPDIVLSGEKFNLENGMSLKLFDKGRRKEILPVKMSIEKKLALGLPINLNYASSEELMLIPGIGEATVRRIIERRHEIGRFQRLEQLTHIKGIKDKKLQKLSKYLYVE